MTKYFVEKFNASDDSFTITEVYVLSGSFVEDGKIITTIESSKSDIEIESQKSGYVYYNFSKGETINVGDLFYIISSEKLNDIIDLFNYKLQSNHEGFTISKKALELIEIHNISPIDLGKKVIKEVDVINFIQNKVNDININKDLIIMPDNNKIPLIIIGAGGGAKMCIDALEISTDYQVVGLLDDKVDIGDNVLKIPVIGNLNCIKELIEINITSFVIAFGVLERRNKRFDLYTSLKELGCKFPNIIHPRAIVEKSVELGEGNVILAGANIGSSVKLGNLNYINNNSLVSHDCVLIDNIHIAPAAALASSIIIESHVLVGMNTTLYFGIKIGESSTILNGLTINNNIEKNSVQKSNN
jgi:sugar O-acyltransferase (sialic acid O-acetyltransferase NeuD family)